ncbi:hypothetical protein MKW98_011386 [Papaver atlanticum]|uniref:Uncharacterized protein n=1 Tax=Papaver atlanticum TaxID=357466 RepID=A0AAD4XLI4_9MAGN|nr:hypothetical protein MKW98_011386 [Papaver atlanticum]
MPASLLSLNVQVNKIEVQYDRTAKRYDRSSVEKPHVGSYIRISSSARNGLIFSCLLSALHGVRFASDPYRSGFTFRRVISERYGVYSSEHREMKLTRLFLKNIKALFGSSNRCSARLEILMFKVLGYRKINSRFRIQKRYQTTPPLKGRKSASIVTNQILFTYAYEIRD